LRQKVAVRLEALLTSRITISSLLKLLFPGT